MVYDDLWMYDLSLNVWNTIDGQKKSGRHFGSLAPFREKWIVVAGNTNAHKTSKSVRYLYYHSFAMLILTASGIFFFTFFFLLEPDVLMELS
jgi:hypothetical protein